jgi:hypothetical protein
MEITISVNVAIGVPHSPNPPESNTHQRAKEDRKPAFYEAWDDTLMPTLKRLDRGRARR